MTESGAGRDRRRPPTLGRKADFERVYREGRRWVSPLFVAFVLVTNGGGLRVGFVASRKVGGAVSRNRAKRLLREVFRRRGPSANVSADVVFVARRAILEADYKEVETQYLRGVGRWFEKICRGPG